VSSLNHLCTAVKVSIDNVHIVYSFIASSVLCTTYVQSYDVFHFFAHLQLIYISLINVIAVVTMSTVVILFLYIVLISFIHNHCGNYRQLSLVCELKM